MPTSATSTPAKTPKEILKSFAARCRAAGLRVSKSPRSATRYISLCYGCEARVSDHELGRADYGSREQHHRGGPEVIVESGWDISKVVAEITYLVRADCYGLSIGRDERPRLAASLRALRLVERRAARRGE